MRVNATFWWDNKFVFIGIVIALLLFVFSITTDVSQMGIDLLTLVDRFAFREILLSVGALVFFILLHYIDRRITLQKKVNDLTVSNKKLKDMPHSIMGSLSKLSEQIEKISDPKHGIEHGFIQSMKQSIADISVMLAEQASVK